MNNQTAKTDPIPSKAPKVDPAGQEVRVKHENTAPDMVNKPMTHPEPPKR